MVGENNNNIKEYFLDTTFQVISKKFCPYKFLIISFINFGTSRIFCFILFIYQEKISYNRIITFLRVIAVLRL